MRTRWFQTQNKKLPLPVFFPDATRAVVKTLDSQDIKSTQTQGILVNTYHLYQDLDRRLLAKFGGIRPFMGWDGGVITDSGGFQIMSLIKSGEVKGEVIDKGVAIQVTKGRKIMFTPEESIRFQALLCPDMMVVLDDFTPSGVSRRAAKTTVDRTVDWARRCKQEFQRIYADVPHQPYLLAVVQGGDYLDLRKECAVRLAEIGFDGFGYGGWPVKANGEFDYETGQVIADNTPKGYFLYGLGIGKPEDIVGSVKQGYQIFDCVLPTRDARHQRLYVYHADSIKAINLKKKPFYHFYEPAKDKASDQPVSRACDCLLCTQYSRAYLAHLFRHEPAVAMRLATIHNLRFYSLLMKFVSDSILLREFV